MRGKRRDVNCLFDGDAVVADEDACRELGLDPLLQQKQLKLQQARFVHEDRLVVRDLRKKKVHMHSVTQEQYSRDTFMYIVLTSCGGRGSRVGKLSFTTPSASASTKHDR